MLSPVELVAGDLTSAARQGILPQVAGLIQGLLVVHAVHGVGQVVGFDPPGRPDRTARVRFVTGLGLMQVEEYISRRPTSACPIGRLGVTSRLLLITEQYICDGSRSEADRHRSG